MIGQKEILKKINNLIENNRFPKFMLMVAPGGYGKSCLCKEISKILNTDMITFGNKVDELRECIQLAYEQKSPILYVITDADTMSTAAKNSILKLIEEPPNNAYIILQAENEQSILPTILSRAYLCKLDNYSVEELGEYLIQKETHFTNGEIEQFIQICDSPGMINTLLLPENKEVLDLVRKLVDNIDKVTLSNLLKMPKKVKLTEAGEGIDINLFLNCVEYFIFTKFMKTKDYGLYKFYMDVVEAKKSMRSNSINKLYVLDSLLIRGWLEWNCGN